MCAHVAFILLPPAVLTAPPPLTARISCVYAALNVSQILALQVQLQLQLRGMSNCLLTRQSKTDCQIIKCHVVNCMSRCNVYSRINVFTVLLFTVTVFRQDVAINRTSIKLPSYLYSSHTY
jgi:hypothetical protein